MSTLENKTILITGGAQGVGEAAGRVFASHHAKVVLTDIVEDGYSTTLKTSENQAATRLRLFWM